MRLTADLLLQAEGFLNAYKDRELSFRGAKIPLIENLAVLQDQFDVLDFSDNDIKKVDNFPIMKRLNCIILNNNKVLFRSNIDFVSYLLIVSICFLLII